MNSLLILTVVSLGVGAVVALQAHRRTDKPVWRVIAAALAGATVAVTIFTLVWSRGGAARRYAKANHRQGYTLGFGLGQYLKQTQPGRRVVILRCKPDEPLDSATIKGLRDGLDGALTIIGERSLEIPQTLSFYRDYAAQFTPELLAELKATGVDIVVSFHGLPTRVHENFQSQIDVPATQALWRSPEYPALQWVLLRLPDLWKDQLHGLFREGNVLAMVVDKPVTEDEYLERKGTPAELFNAWFELVTTDQAE